jgi:hypothetical protein
MVWLVLGPMLRGTKHGVAELPRMQGVVVHFWLLGDGIWADRHSGK